MPAFELLLNLSENWTLFDPRDARSQVKAAVQAEDAGIGNVMFSEHIVMGAGSDANGRMANPREYAAPGNQEPEFPWPSAIVMMSAVAAATKNMRVVGAATIAPLRHPLLLAKELATLDQLAEGRVVILPSVSWHASEYAALGVDFTKRGEILDEQLEIMRAAWAASPVSFHGKHFDFDEVYVEPKGFSARGPAMWFGGSTMHPRLVKRLVKYGAGLMQMGPVSPDQLAILNAAFAEAGRDISELEMVSGMGGRFSGANDLADLDGALSRFGKRLDDGFRTFVIKPCQFIDDPELLPEFYEELVAKTTAIAAERIG